MMKKDLARPLLKNEQIADFLLALGFKDYFSNINNLNRVFPGHTINNLDWLEAQTITRIMEANSNLATVLEKDTYGHKDYRAAPYSSDEQREKLRQDIFKELTTLPRLDDDEQITLGHGGMLPQCGKANIQRKAFIITGLPASGKSGIAARVSDYYKAVLIDSDFAKRKLPEFCRRNGASLVHNESKIISNLILEEMLKYGVNIVLPIIGSDYDDVLTTIKNLQYHNYTTNLILVELDRVKSTMRALCRFLQTDRYIPLSKILDDYSNNPSLVFYRLLANNYLGKLPLALISTDVPY